MTIISLSTMKPIKPEVAEVGQMVNYSGDMANASGSGAVTAVYPSSYGASYDVILLDGRKIRVEGTSFAKGIGRRFELENGFVGADTVAMLIAKNASFEAIEKAKESEAANAFAAETERLKSEYPKLLIGGGRVVAAKNMRTLLKAAWPKVKFSVTGSSFSGGNSIRVSWTDGPTSDEVDKIVDRFSPGWFDGMTDSYNYRTSPWSELFGSAKYISTSRDYSDALVAKAIAAIVKNYEPKEIPTPADYNAGLCMGMSPIEGGGYRDDWNSMINRECSALDGS